MDSDLDHEFSPNSPPRGHYSDLGPKGAKRGPKGAKREPKGTKGTQKRDKRHQKGANREPKLYQNSKNIYKKKISSDADCLMFSVGCLLAVVTLPRHRGGIAGIAAGIWIMLN